MKTKLTLYDQIKYLKNDKNIKFVNFSEQEAFLFLSNSNYLFKIKAYAKLFYKIDNTSKYKDLDFGQLVELSKIDMYLRKIFFDIILAIEHSLKIQLINDISRNPFEDGYSIVQRFFSSNNYSKSMISKRQNKDNYSSKIVDHNIQNISVWMFLELIDFGTFESFYSFYFKDKIKKRQITKNEINEKTKIINYLWNIKKVRNACAHNNCLLVSLNRKPIIKNSHSKEFKSGSYTTDLGKLCTFTDGEKKLLQSFLIKDLSIVLLVFFKIVKSKKLKKAKLNELKNLFDNRFIANKNLFKKEEEDQKKLIDFYHVMKKIIDKYDTLI